jgi:hypothetical protein
MHVLPLLQERTKSSFARWGMHYMTAVLLIYVRNVGQPQGQTKDALSLTTCSTSEMADHRQGNVIETEAFLPETFHKADPTRMKNTLELGRDQRAVSPEV